MRITETELKNSITIRSGVLRSSAASLYAIVYNEMFFLPAFFDHYRRLGVQQFLILDDGSDDGTERFLREQPDCVLLGSPFKFGQPLIVTSNDGRQSHGRAGIYWKRLIPQHLLPGEFALYADADEFLILPKRVKSVPELFKTLADRHITHVAASLVDFFPLNITNMDMAKAPMSFEDLLADYSYFDAIPLIQLTEGKQPLAINSTVSTRLFARHGVKQAPRLLCSLPGWLVDALPFPPPGVARKKTPVIRSSATLWLKGSHQANVAPPSEVMLALAHFKFTSDFAKRIKMAMARKSHSRNGEKYFQYDRLMQRMRQGDGAFASTHTVPFRGPESLESCGLMRWPDPW
jgi:hypothetical protein